MIRAMQQKPGLSVNSPLAHLLSLVRANRNQQPVVVFDLDSTLFSTSRRTLRILDEFDWPDPSIREKVKTIAPNQLQWHFENHLRDFGVTDEVLLSLVHKCWEERFFTSPYLALDEPAPGARQFVRRVLEEDGRVVYLTGRDEPGMGEGTRRSLTTHGFPLDNDTVLLLMKERFEIKDADFKQSAIARLKTLGTVVGAIDNQPDLVRIFRTAFPGAFVIYFQSVYPAHEQPPDPFWPTITDFNLPEEVNP